jgi:hypothetical protein
MVVGQPEGFHSDIVGRGVLPLGVPLQAPGYTADPELGDRSSSCLFRDGPPKDSTLNAGDCIGDSPRRDVEKTDQKVGADPRDVYHREALTIADQKANEYTLTESFMRVAKEVRTKLKK